MAQIVISVGSYDLNCLKNAIQMTIGDSDYTAHVTTARNIQEMNAVPTDDTLESLTAKLSTGSITSACLHIEKKTPIQMVLS